MKNDNQQTVLPPRPVGRPSTISTLVPQRSHADRAAVANKYHTLSRAAAEDAVSYAVMAGLELAAAKATLDHGEFTPWIEKHCQFSERTAQKYIALAERMVECKGLKGVVAQLPGGQVQTAGDRKVLLAAIRETADGNTLRELYLDFGIIRERVEPELGGARAGAGRPTTFEAEQAKRLMAWGDWEAISKPLARYVTSNAFLHLKDEQLRTVREVLAGALKYIDTAVGKRA